MNQKAFLLALLISFSSPDHNSRPVGLHDVPPRLRTNRATVFSEKILISLTGLGHIQVNLRGIEKRAFISIPEKVLSWKSRYGSINLQPKRQGISLQRNDTKRAWCS